MKFFAYHLDDNSLEEAELEAELYLLIADALSFEQNDFFHIHMVELLPSPFIHFFKDDKFIF